MRLASALLVLVGSAALGAEPTGTLKGLQGAWVIEDATLGGRDHKTDFAEMKLTVTGTTYVIDFADNSDTGEVTLDDAKTPTHIDLSTRKDGPFKGRTLVGVVELKGDTVRLCLNSEKPDRPTTFEAPAKTPLMLLTLKRAKK